MMDFSKKLHNLVVESPAHSPLAGSKRRFLAAGAAREWFPAAFLALSGSTKCRLPRSSRHPASAVPHRCPAEQWPQEPAHIFLQGHARGLPACAGQQPAPGHPPRQESGCCTRPRRQPAPAVFRPGFPARCSAPAAGCTAAPWPALPPD